MNDTIVAQATAPGRGGIGILRISGNQACKVAEKILGYLPRPRYANYLKFKDLDGTILDSGIALWFPKTNSYTGEDVLELQGHGGPVVLDMLLKCILKISGVRIAKPGEFSERAFLNNKLDLAQAEAIADLIDASSEQAARSATQSLNGVFSCHINTLIKKLTDLRVYIEASIDFAEEDINFFSDKKIISQFNQIIKDLNSVYISAHQGNLLREGIKVVLAGYPNAGKSSLLNALVGYERAIVSNIPGTTRDVLREYIQIDGVPLYIIDTAGLCITHNKVEQIGIERAWKEIEQADHVLFIVDSSTTNEMNPDKILNNLTSRHLDHLPITIIRNKVDITSEVCGINNINGRSLICLSAHTGEGIDILYKHLKKIIGFNSYTEGSIFLARRRHLQALEKAENYLMKGKEALIKGLSIEFLAEELRLAQQELNEITGKFTSNDLLGQIFSNFCIGK